MTLSSGRFFEEGDLPSRRDGRGDGVALQQAGRKPRPPPQERQLRDPRRPLQPARHEGTLGAGSAPDGLQPPGGGPLRPHVRRQGSQGEAAQGKSGRRGLGQGFGTFFLERAEGATRRSTAPRKTWRGRPGSPGRARPSGSRRGLRRSRSGPPTGSWRAPTIPTRSPAWNRK